MLGRDINSRFALTPSSINMKRSVFDRSSSLKTTFSTASLVPIYVDEILPGDSVDMKISSVIRLTTSIHPTMDSAYNDTYFFFVPNRLVMDNWEEFCGANPNPWITNQPVVSIPKINLNGTDTVVDSLFDYMGIPIGYNGQVNCLPFRAYNLIWNDWFRDTNLQTELPVPISGGDLAVYYKVRKACKFHDYFTSCLPGPQRHADITIPLGTTAPVYPSLTDNPIYPDQDGLRLARFTGGGGSYIMETANSHPVIAASTGRVFSFSGEGGGAAQGVTTTMNLVADLTNASSATINQLRLAFQTQKFYERMGIATGGRYISVLKTMFGVNNGDLRLQRPQYLGGSRDLINMAQVTQNSQTQTTPLGTVAGQSVTRGNNGHFVGSFTEHGFIIGVSVVRPVHTYQYGLERLWTRSDLLSYYWPSLAFIGEQPVLNKEIYAQSTTADDQVFGYQEAWAEYRFARSKLTSKMRSNVTGTLDSWHYGDKYTALPTLGSSWIEETPSNVDRTLAVQSTAAPQFVADFYFHVKHTRVMPVYSVPGLIDHF